MTYRVQACDIWWKNAVVYCVDVETFQDSNGDGIGDFAGLTRRVDYLAGLGITCLWLMPFFPSPDRDDGYDITDYYSVDPRLGTLGDVVEFLRAARERGIRVISDLVVNHTSDQHPWFRSARSSRRSPHRDWYVWADEPAEGPEPVFPGVEDSTWTYDEVAGQWYFHRFYAHQPDLNTANPTVEDEVCRIIGFWLELGFSGFRIDAAPFVLENPGVAAAPADPHAFLRHLRAFVGRRRGDAILLGEANLDPAGQRQFFGDEDGDELQMLFDFLVNQALFLSLVRGNAAPLVEAIGARPDIPPVCQYANFVRNHDELTLDKLDDDEREEVFAAFAPDESMRAFGRGIRRRLAPMLDGDIPRLKLVYSLAFSLPGTPVLTAGEEIGLGDDLSLDGRMAVRTAMHWANAPNAGFSTAAPGSLPTPVLDDGPFGYQRVNVADQRHDPDSLLNWMERLIRATKESPELQWGRWQALDAGNPAVLAQQFDLDGSRVVTLHNLSAEPVAAQLDLDGHLDEVLGAAQERAMAGSGPVPLVGYGCRWFRLHGPPAAAAAMEGRRAVDRSDADHREVSE